MGSNTMTSCLGSRLALPPHIRFKSTTRGSRLFWIWRKEAPFSKMPGCVWKVKYDSKMLRVDADFLNTKKNIRFRNCQVTCERARKIWHKSGFGLVNYFYNKNHLS